MGCWEQERFYYTFITVITQRWEEQKSVKKWSLIWAGRGEDLVMLMVSLALRPSFRGILGFALFRDSHKAALSVAGQMKLSVPRMKNI